MALYIISWVWNEWMTVLASLTFSSSLSVCLSIPPQLLLLLLLLCLCRFWVFSPVQRPVRGSHRVPFIYQWGNYSLSQTQRGAPSANASWHNSFFKKGAAIWDSYWQQTKTKHDVLGLLSACKDIYKVKQNTTWSEFIFNVNVNVNVWPALFGAEVPFWPLSIFNIHKNMISMISSTSHLFTRTTGCRWHLQDAKLKVLCVDNWSLIIFYLPILCGSKPSSPLCHILYGKKNI